MKKLGIKKLIKGALNSKTLDGVKEFQTEAEKRARLVEIDALSSPDLKELLLNVDGDGKAIGDVSPRDAREEIDSDNDGVANNLDIIKTKIKADEIYVIKQNNIDVAAAGSMKTIVDKLDLVKVTLEGLRDRTDLTGTGGLLEDGNFSLIATDAAGNEQAREVLVEIGTNDSDYTSDGINDLIASVLELKSKYDTFSAQVDDMPAKDGVTYLESEVGSVYNIVGASVMAAPDMADTKVALDDDAGSGIVPDATTAANDSLAAISNIESA